GITSTSSHNHPPRPSTNSGAVQLAHRCNHTIVAPRLAAPYRFAIRYRTGRLMIGRDDWSNAAAVATAAGGIDAVRVEALARRLGVTKGSFYWHFADRSALLDAVLTRWEEASRSAMQVAAG